MAAAGPAHTNVCVRSDVRVYMWMSPNAAYANRFKIDNDVFQLDLAPNTFDVFFCVATFCVYIHTNALIEADIKSPIRCALSQIFHY